MRISYPWPASAITEQDMRLLHAARETRNPRVPITRLLVMAVREKYGVLMSEDTVDDHAAKAA